MPAQTDPPSAPGASSLFYDRLLDYIVVALLAVEGLVAAWLGVSMSSSIDRAFADDVAAEFAASGDLPPGVTEAELADAVLDLGAWAAGGLAATGVALLAVAVLFYRYRGRVVDRVEAGERAPRWHAPLLGGILATALLFVPFVQVLGGGVAGYLSDRSSVVDGALAGVVFGAPGFVLWGALVVGALRSGLPSLSVLFGGALILYVVVDVVLATIGGLVGGLVA
ncbi:MAG: DUF5518 domain-containing protein [Halobacterium sp.]